MKDINPGPSHSYPTNLTTTGGTLYFTATDGTHGTELWRSDGTAAGTELVKDIVPGPEGFSPNPGHVAAVGGTLFFNLNVADGTDGVDGSELWKSDGTAAGTVMVKDIDPGPSGSLPSDLTAVGNTLFFTASDGTRGHELWRSNGTSTGTVQVKDIRPDFDGSEDDYYGRPKYLTAVGGTLYFAANDGGTAGNELWKSNGSGVGTVRVKDIRPGRSGSNPSDITRVRNDIYFTADTGKFGRELWKSNGSAAGTVLVEDINPGRSSSYAYGLTALNGALLFTASNPAAGRELWKSNGTRAGTFMVKDIKHTSGASESFAVGPRDLVASGKTLYFTAQDGATGRELWRSNGTTSGTIRIKDIRPGAASSNPGLLTTNRTTLYFYAAASAGRDGYWKSNGTRAGTVRLR